MSCKCTTGYINRTIPFFQIVFQHKVRYEKNSESDLHFRVGESDLHFRVGESDLHFRVGESDRHFRVGESDLHFRVGETCFPPVITADWDDLNVKNHQFKYRQIYLCMYI